MKDTYATIAATIAANEDGSDDDPARVRIPYEIGFFARHAFSRGIAYGRSLGLDVEVHSVGGLLSQSGWIVAVGRWGDVRRFLTALNGLERVS